MITPRLDSNLRIDPARLWLSLMETATIGGTAKGGVKRLTLSNEDKQVRDWLKIQAEAIGCTLTVDHVGNMYVRRAGRDETKPPIAFGSHLDTQPTGGKFDGVLGVLAGLEALRTLHAAGFETEAPLLLINWTNEEGSRFSPAMLGSGVFGGAFTGDYADARSDGEGTTFAEAIEAIGYRGTDAPPQKLSAYFELHIEQGPILEAEAKQIGVVTGIQGIRWYDAVVTGADAHTGTTPMDRRKDALAAAARLVEAVRRITIEEGGGGVGTVGSLVVEPNARNVIPGVVRLGIDLRHPSDLALARLDAALHAEAQAIAKAEKLEIALDPYWSSPAVVFDKAAVETVRGAAEKLGYSTREIVSGAGHDAAYTARVAPTAMIFVPCADGVSHNEAESITFEAAAEGGQVLLEAILAWDARKG